MKAILFDMDRTLVPMDEELFIKTYFGGLARKLCPVGIEKDPLIAAIWKATGAMIKNDGSHTNYEVFGRYLPMKPAEMPRLIWKRRMPFIRRNFMR